MKLNIDCVRDVMLTLEEAEYGELTTISILCKKLEDKYTEEEITYTCLKLDEGGLIDAMLVSMMNSSMKGVKAINDITFEGHQFLNNIRDNKVWGKTKTVLSKVSSVSISFVSSIASQVLATLISQYMGLNQPLSPS